MNSGSATPITLPSENCGVTQTGVAQAQPESTTTTAPLHPATYLHAGWALRRKRNANDYTGDGVTPDMVGECITQGRRLNALLLQHLQREHPALFQSRG